MPSLTHSPVIDRSKKLPALFYETSNGNQPVRDWILARAAAGLLPAFAQREQNSRYDRYPGRMQELI